LPGVHAAASAPTRTKPVPAFHILLLVIIG